MKQLAYDFDLALANANVNWGNSRNDKLAKEGRREKVYFDNADSVASFILPEEHLFKSNSALERAQKAGDRDPYNVLMDAISKGRRSRFPKEAEIRDSYTAPIFTEV